MKTWQNGFDWLSPVYDFLARLIYGSSIQNSQSYLLKDLRAGASVLIMGGGTGWILNEIHRRQPSVTITFVDTSIGMIQRAKRRSGNIPGITFIHGNVHHVPAKKFDVIILPFFLDMFSQNLKKEVEAICEMSCKDTQWLITDFISTGKAWQNVLLFVMYRFFRIACSIEATHLPDWRGTLSQMNFSTHESKSFHNGFILSIRSTRS